jgi:hypothetical protein
MCGFSKAAFPMAIETLTIPSATHSNARLDFLKDLFRDLFTTSELSIQGFKSSNQSLSSQN